VPKILDKRGPPHVSPSIVGVRYFLACFVVFNHVGKTEDDDSGPPSGWRSFANARLFCIHMPCFFLLAGFSLSQTMSRVPKSKFRFFLSRFSAMYPMYFISILLLFISFLVTCNPTTYRPTFNSGAQANDTAVAHFCEPPPLMESAGWGGSFAVTLLVTVLGLQAWPFAWPFAWWISYYAWFSSVYYFCVLCHPWLHGWLMQIRGNKPGLLGVAFLVAFLNYAVVVGFWFPFEEGFDDRRPTDNSYSTFETEWANWYSLGYYLFPPFWMPIFGGGVVSAFVFDAYRPYAGQPKGRWTPHLSGTITDAITVLLLGLSATTIVAPEGLRPSQVDDSDDQGIRTYAAVMSRIYAPLLAAWLYAMAAGHGATAWVFSRPFMVNVLAPTAYNIYIFHQWVGQMYWWVTRNDMWSYWRYRKDYYWFSSKAVPVDWWEYPLLMVLTTAWAMFMNIFNPRLILLWNEGVRRASRWLTVGSSASMDVTALETVLKVVTDLTGLDPDPESSVLECGIASFGMPVLLHMLKAEFPGVQLTVAELLEAETLRGLSETLTSKLNQRAETPTAPGTADHP
jgi:aryl carrier-like protein